MKASLQMTSTEQGMLIDRSDEQYRNAAFSIRTSPEPGSKVTVDSREQLEKQPLQMTSTDEGMQIDESQGQ
jgi:hypothetical protein